jgi:hypothetical protein
MPNTLAECSRTAKTTVASFSPTDLDFDQLCNDPQNVARATQASLARQQSSRRRLVDPTTRERNYAAAELEFTQAMAEYKRRSGRMFPTWCEVLEVLCSLGYEKTAGDHAVQVPGDWSGRARVS